VSRARGGRSRARERERDTHAHTCAATDSAVPTPPSCAGEAGAYLPIVNTLLDGVLGFDEAQFRAEISWLYPLLSGLIGCGSVEIRQRVRVVFDQRIRGMLPF